MYTLYNLLSFTYKLEWQIIIFMCMWWIDSFFFFFWGKCIDFKPLFWFPFCDILFYMEAIWGTGHQCGCIVYNLVQLLYIFKFFDIQLYYNVKYFIHVHYIFHEFNNAMWFCKPINITSITIRLNRIETKPHQHSFHHLCIHGLNVLTWALSD